MAPNGESETQVMNPLMGPALSSRGSLHCLDSPEPQRKKLRLSGSFHGDDVSKPKNAAATPPPSQPTTAITTQSATAPQPPAPPQAVSNGSKLPTTHEASGTTAAPLNPKIVESSPAAVPNQPPDAGPSGKPEESRLGTTRQDEQNAIRYSDLKEKYYDELSYMLREFEKLERQLLGARKTEENAGSRERREKLHSFIIHLQDTITQIEAGGQQENTSQKNGEQESAARPLKETVQKLEEHILANLLPVKVRLKKQLAAQQGARHNPVGMPHRGWNQQPKDNSKGTFVAAAEKKMKQAEEAAVVYEAQTAAKPVEPHQTQYGKPIENGGGSSLTKKLHGQTLGKSGGQQHTATKDDTESKRYYGGMALGSDQIESSVTAASSVHKLIIKDTGLLLHQKSQASSQERPEAKLHQPPPPKEVSAQVQEKAETIPKLVVEPKETTVAVDLQDEERRRRRRRRRRKRMLREQERKGIAAEGDATKLQGKKSRQAKKQRGPRQVEYMCALCNETYAGTCEFNPWWALTQHDCTKCHKTQIPKVDISAPANAIEYHPALLAHADDNGASAANNVPPPLPPEVELVVSKPTAESPEDHISLGSDVSSGLDDISSDEDDLMGIDSDGDDSACLTPADKAENEHFGAQYEGPKLEPEDSARLLALMSHASTCSGRHRSKARRDVCRSTQWMMLHVRDCPGTTASGDICPFPWCRKVKHLLFHLVSCQEGQSCAICAGHLNDNMQNLVGLNNHRLELYREKLFSNSPEERAAARVVQTTKPTKSPGVPKSSRSSTEAKEVPKATKEKSAKAPSVVVKAVEDTPSTEQTRPKAVPGQGTTTVQRLKVEKQSPPTQPKTGTLHPSNAIVSAAPATTASSQHTVVTAVQATAVKAQHATDTAATPEHPVAPAVPASTLNPQHPLAPATASSPSPQQAATLAVPGSVPISKHPGAPATPASYTSLKHPGAPAIPSSSPSSKHPGAPATPASSASSQHPGAPAVPASSPAATAVSVSSASVPRPGTSAVPDSTASSKEVVPASAPSPSNAVSAVATAPKVKAEPAS
mmetsp:Transcript_17583/g.38338  ORF Transcript_17583/g.38338 Transcript_17583/m.38338 type:complete len:1051 (-) Transcript_17583:176-3328(-)